MGVTAAEFTALITNIKDDRDKFVAHLDEERTMLLPALETAKKSIAFLHGRLVQHPGGLRRLARSSHDCGTIGPGI